MKHWKSYWIFIVAILHTAYAINVFRVEYVSLYENDFINSITTAQVGAAVWFFLFGQLLFIVGQLMRSYEKDVTKQYPIWIGLNLLLLTLVGVILMPASGFWLVFPPAIAMMLPKAKFETVPA